MAKQKEKWLSRTLKIGIQSFIFFVSFASANNNSNDRELLERQKELYRASQNDSTQWDAFFGGAVYLRALGNSKTIDHSMALEIMALGRHCQWSALRALDQMHLNKENLPLSTKAMALIRLKKGFQIFISDPKNFNKNFIQTLSKIREQWSLTERELRLLTHPENLRLHVRSLCD